MNLYVRKIAQLYDTYSGKYVMIYLVTDVSTACLISSFRQCVVSRTFLHVHIPHVSSI